MNAAAAELIILGLVLIVVPTVCIGSILVSSAGRHPTRDCLLLVLLLGLTWLGAWNVAWGVAR